MILWLQGGPGDTSLFGLFTENGPFHISANNTLKPRKYSWTVNHNVIYVDSPAGTGYSFTDSELGYASSVTDVARDLYSAVAQFFELFPELQKNDFYISGESYAGKYVPALAHETLTRNSANLNLKGLSIGNGWMDPVNQVNYADYLYQLGLIDLYGRDLLRSLQDKAVYLIRHRKYVEANLAFAEFKLFFRNLTGLDYIFNYLDTRSSDGSESFDYWVQRPDVRKALHVGNSTFNADDKVVLLHLASDIAQSVAHLFADLLKNYRVLVYNGQLDIVCAYPMAENVLRNLEWSGAEEYKTAKRRQWWVNKKLAGYAKTVGNLTEVLVRNAGHSVPAEQPAWAWDLITRLTRNKSF